MKPHSGAHAKQVHPIPSRTRLSAILPAAVLLAIGAACAAPAPKPAPVPPPRLAAPPSAHPPATSAAKPAASALDTAQVRKWYMESDFDEATAALEGALKDKRPLAHADSVFIFKYLAVMYTSKYDTRELGKRYMYQLLSIDPAARINDMYASDMIYMIFKNVQDEYFAAHPHDAPPLHPGQPGPSSGHAAWYWVGGTGLAVAAGVTAYLLLAPSGKKIDHAVDEPK